MASEISFSRPKKAVIKPTVTYNPKTEHYDSQVRSVVPHGFTSMWHGRPQPYEFSQSRGWVRAGSEDEEAAIFDRDGSDKTKAILCMVAGIGGYLGTTRILDADSHLDDQTASFWQIYDRHPYASLGMLGSLGLAYYGVIKLPLTYLQLNYALFGLMGAVLAYEIYRRGEKKKRAAHASPRTGYYAPGMFPEGWSQWDEELSRRQYETGWG